MYLADLAIYKPYYIYEDENIEYQLFYGKKAVATEKFISK